MRLPWQRQAQPETRSLTEAQWFRLFDRQTTKAGANVTTESALYSSVVAACLAVRAEAQSTLPLHVYRETDGRRVKATNRPEYLMLKAMPNTSMTSAHLRQWLRLNIDVYGNAYLRRERRGSTTVALYPLIGATEPIIETVKGTPRIMGYRHREYGASDWTPIPAADVLHFASPFIDTDGVKGRSLVDIAKESIGLDIASEEFIARVLKNGTHMGVVLTTEQTLTAQDIEDIKQMLSDGQGVAPAGKARLFTKGIKPEVLGSTVQQAEMIEQRRYNVERICGVFKVPLVKVQAMWFGTYSNTEQADLAFSKDCVVPMCVQVEQVFDAKLFPAGEFYTKHELNGLMRGDFATRMEGLAAAVNGGIFTPNEARAWEELDPLPGGDELRFPLNSTPASQLEDTEDEPEDDDESPAEEDTRSRIAERRAAGKSRVQVQESMRGVFEDTARRIVRREANDIRREARKILGSRSVTDFELWLKDFYRDFPDFYRKQLEPVVRSYGQTIADLASAEADGVYDAKALDAFVKGYVNTSSKRYMASHQGQLEKLLKEEADKLAAVEERLDGWEETTPSKFAQRESVEGAGAFAKWAFVAAGVTRLMWVNTSSKSCPYCDSLDGKIVGIDTPFVEGGGAVLGTDGTALPVSQNSFHPPVHAGCACTVVPT